MPSVALQSFEYAELWYFTDAMHQWTQNEDTFSLTKVDEVVSFRPVSALKASRNIIQDMELSWQQMKISKTTLIQHIIKCSQAQKAITPLVQFFMNIKVHHYCQRAYGEHALLTYQAHVRHDWHDQLKLGSSFNIAVINEMLLQLIHQEIMDKKQAEALDKVSHLMNIHNISAYCFLSLFFLHGPPHHCYCYCYLLSKMLHAITTVNNTDNAINPCCHHYPLFISAIHYGTQCRQKAS